MNEQNTNNDKNTRSCLGVKPPYEKREFQAYDEILENRYFDGGLNTYA